MVSPNDGLPNDRLRLPPPWISPAAGMPDREVRPVIIVQRRRLFYPAYVQDYLDRVTAADVAAGNTSGLEVGVTDGANTFIQDLVSDTYLGVSGGVISQAASVIKASVPMAGARTRLGAMTPLVGPAPTSFNFGNNDYNRKTGLVGDGNAKYLDSNRNNNADPQNSVSHAVWISVAQSTGGYVPIGAGFNSTGSTRCSTSLNPLVSTIRIRTSAAMGSNPAAGAINNSFFGYRRSASNASLLRMNSIDYPRTEVSETPFNGNVFVFADNNNGSTAAITSSRLAFYSIGESLDLAILDARVTALINAYAAAIP
jgi:hypothetical protein